MLTIFDCDGVLVDSEIIASELEAERLGAIDYPITPQDVSRRFAGLTTVDITEIIESEIGRPLPEGFRDDHDAELNRRLAEEVDAIPGIHDLLDILEGPRGVCSNSSMARLEIMMRRTQLWERFAPHIFSAVEVADKRPKPAPDVYRHAIAQFGADPRQTVIVEDSVFGVTAAHAAGARVVGFTGGAHAWTGLADLLTEAGAETVIHRHADLPKVAEALRAWDGIAG